ncbi:hypothetical protein BDZ97DRAFT_1732982 [Flammula alnicola]|nr:hypothetical protein BDZ97DRAFT_1732982 [Flammula alnicola]
MPSGFNPPSVRDQYHHYIPRFILRQFQIGPRRTKRARTKSFSKAHKTEEDAETIFFYDISSGLLQIRPLSRVYGRVNLYRDGNNPANVDHLEVKLSVLENNASWVIRSIHGGLKSQQFTLSRLELATLRKFIFLMHYRNDAVSSTYFQEKRPHNAPLANWIRRYKKTRHLATEVDVWLDGLRYYLDTPHQEIVATGERIRERYGDHRLHEMLRRGVDPDIEDWYAIDYESQANYFFLGVWEAAADSEFVLGGNGFGLWEGLIYGSPGAHRLYVVSPRIAIVLRRTFLHHPHSNDPSVLYSCLAGIAITQPKIEYANKDIFLDVDDADEWTYKNLRDTYRSSPQAQEDRFTFGITKLTNAETFAVNEVIMMNANLHPTGSLTFSSPNTMHETLRAYMASHNTFLGGKRILFRPLLQELSNMKHEAISPSPIPLLTPNLSWNADTDADLQLHMFLRFTIARGIEFPSSYNRAYLIFHMATDAPSLSNSVSSRIRRISKEGISKLRYLLDPPLPSFGTTSSASKTIVETLPKDDSNLFFSLLGHQVDQLRVGRLSNDLLANLIYEAAMIGITHWLAEMRPDVLTDLLYPWITIIT